MDVQPISPAQPTYPSVTAPPPVTPGPAAAAGLTRVARFEFTGTGGELLGQALVGLLLTAVTFGIYQPWFLVRMRQWLYSRTRLITPAGPLQLSFEGTGFLCLVEVYLTALLIPLTLGIYTPWYIANATRFFTNNSHATAADGTRYRLDYSGTGGQLFGLILVNMLLSMVTFGIYTPWAVCNLQRATREKTSIYRGTEKVGSLSFVGTGGGLIGTYLLGTILTMVTFGLYLPWYEVSLWKFFQKNSGVHIGGKTYRGDFAGTGGELFVILLHLLLVPFTFGLYLFWVVCKENRFYLNNSTFVQEG
jgi:uncharacterized membrane protein YjgN (DUF898 family)